MCKICESESNLKKHKEEKHKSNIFNENSTESTPVLFPCDVCDDKSNSADELRKHKEDCHVENIDEENTIRVNKDYLNNMETENVKLKRELDILKMTLRDFMISLKAPKLLLIRIQIK